MLAEVDSAWELAVPPGPGDVFTPDTGARLDQSGIVYINNKPLGEARGTTDNRFLIARDFNLPTGESEVRADVIDRKTGDVVAPSGFMQPMNLQTLRKHPLPCGGLSI